MQDTWSSRLRSSWQAERYSSSERILGRPFWGPLRGSLYPPEPTLFCTNRTKSVSYFPDPIIRLTGEEGSRGKD